VVADWAAGRVRIDLRVGVVVVVFGSIVKAIERRGNDDDLGTWHSCA